MSALRKVLLAMFTFALLHCAVPGAWAEEIGQVKNVTGKVSLQRGAAAQLVKASDLIQPGDVVSTGPDGSAGITFIDNSRLSIGPNSRVEIAQYRYNPTTQEGEFLADIQRGTLVIVSGNIAKQPGEPMKVKTPTTVLTVRGTTFAVKVDE